MALSPGTAPFPTRPQNPTDIVKWLLGKDAAWGRVPLQRTCSTYFVAFCLKK